MFDEIINDGISGLKALIGRVLAVLVAAAIMFLAGVGITIPGLEPDPTPTPMAEPTETMVPVTVAPVTSTPDNGTIPVATDTPSPTATEPIEPTATPTSPLEGE